MKAIFLDRDGTLIQDKGYLNDPNQIEYLDGVVPALQRLRDDGFVFLVVSNQSGLSSGRVQVENVDEIHRRLRQYFHQNAIEILEFYIAQAASGSDDFLRKPNPGMLLAAAHDYNIDLAVSWMVGDKMIDVEAGRRCGCRTVLLSAKKNIQTDGAGPEFVCANWREAAEAILCNVKGPE
jgi:histidinol-phosphate phosphatase family protein